MLDALFTLPDDALILDVGTGPARLIELGLAQTPFRWQGADIDEAMLAQARGRLNGAEVPLHHLTPDRPLTFDDGAFDALTFCSVLYLLPDPLPLLAEAWRVLKPGGRLVALTATGEGRITPYTLGTIGPHPANWTFLLWRRMTAVSGQAWARKGVLADFARQQGAIVQQIPVFKGLAVVEVVERASA
ncbi:MAG: class I SAM-dependent methyltransferase [Anaerolineae bacterium]